MSTTTAISIISILATAFVALLGFYFQQMQASRNREKEKNEIVVQLQKLTNRIELLAQRNEQENRSINTFLAGVQDQTQDHDTKIIELEKRLAQLEFNNVQNG